MKKRVGCPTCGGWGWDVLISKPEIEDSVWDLVAAADLARKASWPLSGGWIEQTAVVVQGVRMIWRFQDYWRAKLGITNDR